MAEDRFYHVCRIRWMQASSKAVMMIHAAADDGVFCWCKKHAWDWFRIAYLSIDIQVNVRLSNLYIPDATKFSAFCGVLLTRLHLTSHNIYICMLFCIFRSLISRNCVLCWYDTKSWAGQAWALLRVSCMHPVFCCTLAALHEWPWDVIGLFLNCKLIRALTAKAACSAPELQSWQ